AGCFRGEELQQRAIEHQGVLDVAGCHDSRQEWQPHRLRSPDHDGIATRRDGELCACLLRRLGFLGRRHGACTDQEIGKLGGDSPDAFASRIRTKGDLGAWESAIGESPRQRYGVIRRWEDYHRDDANMFEPLQQCGRLVAHRCTLAEPPRTRRSTSSRPDMLVSPGVVMASAPCAAPYSTHSCGELPLRNPKISPDAKESPPPTRSMISNRSRLVDSKNSSPRDSTAPQS